MYIVEIYRIRLDPTIKNIFNFAPLTLRIIAGIGFMIYGLPKLLDIQATQNSFANMGLPPELAIII
jgi:uncharacterized membrane protein YphA (DoxX/SURF4 family)